MNKMLIISILFISSLLSLTIATLSQISRAQASKSGPFQEPIPAGQKGWEEWPNPSPDTNRRLNFALNSMSRSVHLTKQADIEADQANWAQAKTDYQQALMLFPDYSEARYGLGQCAEASGDVTSAIQYYRANIYSHDARYGTIPGDGYRENNVGRLMEYVLLLSQAGQTREALTVYHRAAGLLNYRDGKPYIDVLLPDFGPGGWSYTPQRLQAMAHIAIAYGKEGFNDKLALSHLQQATALAPDSPIPYFYRGRHESMFTRNDSEAKAYYVKAAKLGDKQVKMVAVKSQMIVNGKPKER